MKRFIENYKGEKFDIIVVGGGITGAAVAYAASSRGMKVALLEKADFGGATSAATSKLIHGGLRYLANMEFGLVRESLIERRILGNIAPNFVYPIPFMIPSYRKYRGGMWMIMAGMFLYDMLSFDKKNTWDKSKELPNHQSYRRKKTLRLEPNVKKKKLTGSTIFYDYQSIFPERLTLSFVKSAIDYGAEVSNYSKVTSFKYSDDKITGVIVQDLINNKEVEVNAPLIINCGGTWADMILEMASGKKEFNYKVKRSEGIHIITKKMNNEHVISLVKDNSKHFMIMPWRNHSIIGTTDKEYFGNPDDYKVSKESIMEVIEEVNEYYGADELKYEDIQFAYGGLRPLVDDQTEGSYESSRKYEVYDNEKDGIKGLITVEGGKYTTSRNLASTVLEVVQKKLGLELKDSITYNNYLSGSEIKDMEQFMIKLHKKYSESFEKNTIEYIGRNYGTESKYIFDIALSDSKLSEVLNADGEILAEVSYAIKHEMAKTLKDIFLRRTGLGTLGNPGDELIEKVSNLAGKMLNWDENRKQKEKTELKKAFELPK
ncbi:MAG: glycerol-3-phosphate dehydrogenase/oxidase [Bacteroidales bacterium]|nr:glycerol-3-phosphate dehydrogenase/oxidase [Bacteroidales bacterium]MBN2756065.1 glycerol-3-phosphate dehydrogenase/oxidase [Bacteroidales bacterium]